MLHEKMTKNVPPVDPAGLIVLPLRVVVGWTFFSAFWRRVALADELNPHASGYIGEKFNHFLPHALGIRPVIEYLVSRPAELSVAMTIFTIVEAIVGACIMLGLLTRLMALGLTALAGGILLGSGWLGSTCVDEWQIGILGVASGCVLFFAGGGRYSLDSVLDASYRRLTHRTWVHWVTSGPVTFTPSSVAAVGAAVLALALSTNQYFHGGIYGQLHNDSVRPVLNASDVSMATNVVQFDLTRTAGPDTYGAFLVGLTVTDARTGQQVHSVTADQLSTLPSRDVINHRIALVHPGPHSLVVPLGALAHVEIPVPPVPLDLHDAYTLTLSEVGGSHWTFPVAQVYQAQR